MMPVPGDWQFHSRPATRSEKPRPTDCTTPFMTENPITKSGCDAAGDLPIRQYPFLLLNAYGYSRPRLSIRDIITQCRYSVRYRPQASFRHGNAGRYARVSPGSSAKHHSIISFGYRLSSMHSARLTGVLRKGWRRVKVGWEKDPPEFFHRQFSL